MKKKIAIIAMAITIFIQLAVPCYAVYQKYDTIKNGRIYKFAVSWFTVYDSDSFCTVSMSPKCDNWYDYGKYLVIKEDADGYAYIEKATDIKPESDYLIRPDGRNSCEIPFSEYQADKKLYDKILAFSYDELNKYDMYISVSFKNGRAYVVSLNVNGIPLEKFVEENF